MYEAGRMYVNDCDLPFFFSRLLPDGTVLLVLDVETCFVGEVGESDKIEANSK